MPDRFRVAPVTPSRWKDFARLFESKGCPHYCWCTPYRFRDSPDMSKAERRGAMRTRVASGGPVGVLAYDGTQPVGWCSIAPRESYEGLATSHTMPRVDDRPTWTVLCFFVRRSHRGRGVTRALLAGGIAYAKRRGAQVIEGYPFDTAGITSTHRGHSSVFRRAKFRRNGRRWSLEMRPRAKVRHRPASAAARKPPTRGRRTST